jgi:hypothetical protein
MSRPSTITKTVNLQQSEWVDTYTHEIVQKSDYRLILKFKDGNIVADLTGCSFGVNISDEDDVLAHFDGIITDEEGGVGYVDMEGDSLNFSGDHDLFVLFVDADGNESIPLRIKLPITPRPTGEPEPSTAGIIDWDSVVSYANTATHGPVRPHSGTLEVKATNADGSISIGVKDGLYDPAGSAAAVAGDLTDHENDTNNPHGVTAVQVGADPAGTAAGLVSQLEAQISNHESDTNNPHQVTAGQLGALPAGDAAVDVDPNGTAIAAALASAASAVNLTGTEPSGATKGNSRIARLATGQVAPSALGEGAVDLQHVRTVNTRCASGAGAVALGSNNTASGAGSVAMGDANVVSGLRGAAIGGIGNTVTSDDGISISGGGNTVSGEKAVALGGALNTASGVYAIAGGTNSIASGDASVALGIAAKATATGSRASGNKAESLHAGASVEADGEDAVRASTAVNQKLFSFESYRFLKGGLSVSRAASFDADGDLVTLTAADHRALIGAAKTVTTVTESGTTRTLAKADCDTFIRLTNAGACTLTLPAQTDVTWADGDIIYFRVTTVSPAALTLGGSVVVNNGAAITTLPQHSTFALRRTATENVWDLI